MAAYESVKATIAWPGDWDAGIPGGHVVVDLVTDSFHDDPEYREHIRKTLAELYGELIGDRVDVMFSDEDIDDEKGIVLKEKESAECN